MITQIIPEDDAIYQCLAESEQGSVLSLARLIVVMSEDRPSAPRNIHAETISSSAILLAWEKPLYNADKVIAYSIHYMKAEGKHWNKNCSRWWRTKAGIDTERAWRWALSPAPGRAAPLREGHLVLLHGAKVKEVSERQLQWNKNRLSERIVCAEAAVKGAV